MQSESYHIICVCLNFPFRLKDWSQREAYLELARREKEGLTLIDPELVSLDNIDIPSDEDLGEVEIIV